MRFSLRFSRDIYSLKVAEKARLQAEIHRTTEPSPRTAMMIFHLRLMTVHNKVPRVKRIVVSDGFVTKKDVHGVRIWGGHNDIMIWYN